MYSKIHSYDTWKINLMKILVQLIVFLLVSVQAWSQVAAELPKQETDTTTTASYTGNGLTDTSYLYGTIHMIGKEDYFLTDATKKAFDGSEKVVFEINLENMNDMMSQLGLLMKSFMSDGQTLKDLYSEEEYKVVKTYFEAKGFTSFIWNMMERVKPMFLSMMTATDLSGENPNPMASGDMVSYELELMERAKEQEKPIDGLETAEYQMSMFDSIPYEAQAKMLLESIVSPDTTQAEEGEMERMVRLYKSQDINGMISMFDEDTEGIGKYEDFLLLNRNRNWIPVMSGMMNKQPTFFGVGAGHLAGEEGVVNLLKKAGYTLTPLNNKAILRRL